jgi:tetratricopeptide (TPR) repeat protein
VIERAFGIAPAEYDSRYRAWELAKLSRYAGQFVFDEHAPPLADAKAKLMANPNDAKAHVAYGFALLHAGKGDESKKELDEALRLDPRELSAHYILTKLAASSHDFATMQTHLEAMQKAGGDGYTVQMALAELAKAHRDKVALRAALEAASKFDPSQSEPYKELFKIDVEDKNDDHALDALRKLTHLEQHERPAWRALLERLVKAKKWDEAVRVGESAIFVDVENADIHRNYARALSALEKHDRAAFELESALLCNAKAEVTAEAHALLAGELLHLHDLPGARAHRAEALRLDAENATARALVLP